jgi:hypothetical protein
MVCNSVKNFLFFGNPKPHKGIQEALSLNRLVQIDDSNPKITDLTPLSHFFYPPRKAETPPRKAGNPARKAGHPHRKAETPPRKAGTPARKAETPPRKAGHPHRKAETPPRKAETSTFVAFGVTFDAFWTIFED